MRKPRYDLYNHILGGLYGQALGDAWGMPALMTPEQTWDQFGGWIKGFLPGPEHHPVHAGLPAGRVTDDTEQAFALAQAMIADGAVTVEGTARAIVGWYDRVGGASSPYIGPSTRRAVERLKAGEDPRVTGARGDTNGAAMRVSVVGLIHPGDVMGAVRDAVISCVPTHNTSVGMSGAAAIAGAVAKALERGTTLDGIIASGMLSAEVGRAAIAPWMGASVTRRIGMAVSIAQGKQKPVVRIRELADIIGSTLAIPDSVPAAFGVLAMARGQPIRTATYAAALSGDADTVGAMACAIAGAWRGADAFPRAITARLRKENPELDFKGVARGLTKLAEARRLAI